MAIQLLKRRTGEQRRAAEHGRNSDGKRRARRYTLDRPSTYALVSAERADAFWDAFDKSPCVVRDLSTLGAGLEFEADEPSVNDRIKVHLQLRDHHRASIELNGVVRHARSEEAGVVRAGVEFVDVGALERALLQQIVKDLEAST
ncbi:MAG: PilZ domain-containing protein [Acidimicrobiia bacterium]